MSPASSSARAHLTLVRPSDSQSDPPSDRRLHVRHTLSELDWLNRVRLRYGPPVSLIDLSTGGLQIETSNRLQPGSTVVVQISGPDGEVAIPSSVLRCQVSRVVPYTTYRSSLSFKRALQALPSNAAQGSDGVGNLIQEHARIAAALRRRADAVGEPGPAVTGVAEAALAATLAMIESLPTERAGARFRQHATHVFRSLARDIELGAAPDAMLAALADRLRRSVPAKTIRVVSASAPVGPQGPDTIYFDAVVGGQVTAKLVVEFPRNYKLEDWHLQFLKMAAQLVAFVGAIAPLRPAGAIKIDAPDWAPEAVKEAAPRETAPRETAAVDRFLWEAVVVRYVDGRLLKGYGRNFFPGHGHLQVWPEPDAPQGTAITVPLRHLKAVFFVHNLTGAPSNIDPTPTARGRKIIVTFLDDEVLDGTTLNYATEGPGFFVSPADERGNNVRIFVVNGAVRHVQFP